MSAQLCWARAVALSPSPGTELTTGAPHRSHPQGLPLPENPVPAGEGPGESLQSKSCVRWGFPSLWFWPRGAGQQHSWGWAQPPQALHESQHTQAVSAGQTLPPQAPREPQALPAPALCLLGGSEQPVPRCRGDTLSASRARMRGSTLIWLPHSQSYGPEHLLTFHNLKRIGLLTEQSAGETLTAVESKVSKLVTDRAAGEPVHCPMSLGAAASDLAGSTWQTCGLQAPSVSPAVVLQAGQWALLWGHQG